MSIIFCLQIKGPVLNDDEGSGRSKGTYAQKKRTRSSIEEMSFRFGTKGNFAVSTNFLVIGYLCAFESTGEKN